MAELILTHPGSSHKDEFLACSLLIATHRVPVVRREPVPADLDNPEILVVDVGGEHEPVRGNFDHHQFPRDHPPICALSLVLQDLGIYEDARSFCDWLETSEHMDTRGPMDTAKWLGITRSAMDRLISPIDITLLRRFANSEWLNPGEPIWEVMKMVGEDLVGYLRSLRERLNFIEQHAEFWTLETDKGSFEALFMPRTEPLPYEPSTGLPRFINQSGKDQEVIAMVYPDRRGTGYGISRHNDSKRMEFSGLEATEDDVHFAHSRGFVAKTSTTDPERLKVLLKQAFQG